MSGPLYGGNGSWGCSEHRGANLKVTARNRRERIGAGGVYYSTYSHYSTVMCFAKIADGYICARTWRTKAGYVQTLSDATLAEQGIE